MKREEGEIEHWASSEPFEPETREELTPEQAEAELDSL